MWLLRQLLSPALVLVGHGALTLAATALPMAKLFDVVTDSSLNGNCAAYSTATLDQLASDALKLAEAGSKACDSYVAADPAMVRLFDAFFQGTDATAVAGMKLWYDYVSNWLQNGGVLSGRTKLPLLFCGDHSIRQTMSSPLRDDDGNTHQNAQKTGDTLIVQDSYMKDWWKQVAVAQQVVLTAVYPYWDPQQLVYFFDQKKGSSVTDYQCADDSLGYTIAQGRGSVTLCTSSFSAGGNLGSVAPSPIPAKDFVNGNPPSNQAAQPIDDIMPGAATLFHELLHLFSENKFVPSTGEEYNAWRIMGKMVRDDNTYFTGDNSVDNAESYTFVAGAAYYTQNMPSNGKVVEYYTGYCSTQ
ncbi:hypothetical protein BO94DRAFT_573948 [Aspergillus sclerotioniger CBS 115572]|uniref:Lysine-specific metallo-endopeptidase domain-containing protein n=1 Tax=Aspergillus sclerotioniger CBS 115572 TaxID=1450535 RepID=A0A317X1U7_9EURO|nr:hypothetical protein BO94DRAFT_573948 [Aspergillus sclerotioniger CBS 115572]PWY91527.1 hypothetical protein BO94DRAFT_573948 [Aspergillus sclerotioniger CBS 115572]